MACWGLRGGTWRSLKAERSWDPACDSVSWSWCAGGHTCQAQEPATPQRGTASWDIWRSPLPKKNKRQFLENNNNNNNNSNESTSRSTTTTTTTTTNKHVFSIFRFFPYSGDATLASSVFFKDFMGEVTNPRVTQTRLISGFQSLQTMKVRPAQGSTAALYRS